MSGHQSSHQLAGVRDGGEQSGALSGYIAPGVRRRGIRRTGGVRGAITRCALEGRASQGASSARRRPLSSLNRGGRQAGFSLLEVVVAFAILALSLGLLIRIFSQALNTTALSGDYSRAATLAEARLNSVGVDIPLEPGDHSGESEDGLRWEVSIESYELGEVLWEPVLEPLQVTAVVYWEEARGGRQVALSTLRLADSFDAAGLAPQGAEAQPASRQGSTDR